MSKARQLADLGNAYDDGALSNRNLIINGAMQVAQRGTSETGITGVGYYTVDRVRISFSGATGAIVTQSVVSDQDVGDFIANAVKHDITTAAGAGVVGFNYRVEVGDVKQHVGKEMTLSFYAKADAAVDILPVIVGDTTITPSTITLGTTYQRYTITFTMPAVSGVSYLDLLLRADATVATANYITGVQLEVGDTATPFEHRSYGQELALCQRYYKCGSTRLCFIGVSGRYAFAQVDAHQYRTTPSCTHTFSSSGYGTVLNVGSFAPIGTTYSVDVQTDVGIGMDGIINWTADAEL